MPERLPPETFDLPLAELRIGYMSAVYFNRTKRILEKHHPDKIVTMQVFQRTDAVLCGIDEALAILRLGTGAWTDPDAAERLFGKYQQAKVAARRSRVSDPRQSGEHRRWAAEHEADLDRLWKPGFENLTIAALYEGDEIAPWETVLTIEGPLSRFCHLESLYLGVLARRTRIATNVRNICSATNGKPLLFFADRFDHFRNTTGDGWAAHIGGASGVASESMSAWFGQDALGTEPHCLVAAWDGDVVAATEAFADTIPGVDLVALVDFTNNCPAEALRCAERFGDQLSAVRLDTSSAMIDESITSEQMGEINPTGVNLILVQNVRDLLDSHGYHHVQIIVSGGFTAEKIRSFEAVGAPVDAYAVGESLLGGLSRSYTADVVRPVAKKGRWYRPNPRLEPVP